MLKTEREPSGWERLARGGRLYRDPEDRGLETNTGCTDGCVRVEDLAGDAGHGDGTPLLGGGAQTGSS